MSRQMADNLPKHTRGTLEAVGAILINKVPNTGGGVSSTRHHQGGCGVPSHGCHWATVIRPEAPCQLQTCVKCGKDQIFRY